MGVVGAEAVMDGDDYSGDYSKGGIMVSGKKCCKNLGRFPCCKASVQHNGLSTPLGRTTGVVMTIKLPKQRGI